MNSSLTPDGGKAVSNFWLFVDPSDPDITSMFVRAAVYANIYLADGKIAPVVTVCFSLSYS